MSADNSPVLKVPAGVAAPEPVVAPPTASYPVPGPQAQPVPERPEKTPRKPSARGIPAAPTALAAANAMAVSGSYVTYLAGPGAGALIAAATLLGAASLGTGKARADRARNARARAARSAYERGAALGPSRSRPRKSSGSASMGSVGGRGGGSGRRSAGGGGGLSGGLGRSGSGKHRAGSGGLIGPRTSGSTTLRPGSTRSGKAGSGGSTPSGRGLDRAGSGSTGAGSGRIGRGLGLGKSGSTRSDRAGSGIKPGRSTDRTGSTKPGRASRAEFGGSAPIGSKSHSLAKRAARGLIRRSDGSRRQPIKTAQNVGRAIKTAAQKIGHGSKKAWTSRPGKAMRKAALSTGRQTWRVARTVGAGLWALIGRKGWRGVLQAMKEAWVRSKKKDGETSTTDPAIPGDKVTMPTTLVGAPATGTAPVATTGGGISMAQARFNEAAAEMLGAALVYNPEGMMQVGNDFAHIPEAFRNIAGAMQTMAKRANDQDPIHPAIVDIMQNVYAKLLDAAKLSEELAPAFRNLHAVDIARIESPRRGEERWDLSANRDHVGRS